MIQPADITTLKDLLAKANDVLVLTHESPTFDSIGSTLALYLGLASLGKKATVACPDRMTVEFSSFIGVDKLVTGFGKKNFVISLDYVDGSIEKVSYNIENNKFNLVIEPREGFGPFSADKVHFLHASTAASLIFTVDTIHLGGLGELYENEKELYASRPVVNIDRHPNNAHYGQVNLTSSAASSTAELVAHVLSGIGVRLTTDIATNLLNAFYGATDNFLSPNVTPGAFELSAMCMKAGGKRFPLDMPKRAPSLEEGAALPPFVSGVTPKVQPVSPAPIAASQDGSRPSEGPGGKTPAVAGPVPSRASGQAPQDWLKPKIFKSSNPTQ